jgi:uncharacterized caspase-like protein
MITMTGSYKRWHRTGAALLTCLFCLHLLPDSADAQMQSRDLVLEGFREKPIALWVLSIGVSEYADRRIDLQYADHDAQSIAAVLQTQQGLLFDEVFTKVLTDKEATRQEILRGMSEFLGQASSDDVVLIFLAGHGLQDRQTGTYYFVPHNASTDNLVYEGLPMSNFDEAVRRLKARINKVILWLDTCHAGAVTVAARGVKVGEDLSQALSSASGDYVLSASLAGEESLEDATYRLEGEERAHGAFTYSLLRGLLGAAADESGVVWLSDLFGHVSKEVPRLTGGRQHPHSDMRGTDMPLFVQSNYDAGHSAPEKPLAPLPIITGKKKSRTWLWAVGGGALLGTGALIGLSGGGGGGGGDVIEEPGTIPGPPAHP